MNFPLWLLQLHYTPNDETLEFMARRALRPLRDAARARTPQQPGDHGWGARMLAKAAAEKSLSSKGTAR